MIYLAAPFTHHIPDIRFKRVVATGKAVCAAAQRGVMLYSPILHGFHAEKAFGHEIPWERWMEHGYEMIDALQSITVMELPGWDRSKGVKAEIDFAKAKGYKINRIDLVTCRSFVNKHLIETLIAQEEIDVKNSN